MTRCAVVGAGAWGTALAQVLAGQGHDVCLWAYEPEVASELQSTHTNSTYLPDVELSSALRATSALPEAVSDASIVVYAPPSTVLRKLARQAAASVTPGAIVLDFMLTRLSLPRKSYRRRLKNHLRLPDDFPPRGAVG